MSKNNDSEIRAVASDLDGTLIKNVTNTLPESFFDVIRQVQEKGIRFVAASGRQYYNMKKLLAPVKDEIDFIAENGCLVVHKDQILHSSAIERQLALSLIHELMEVPGTEIMISGISTGYVVSKHQDYIHLLRDLIGIQIKEIDGPEEIQEDMIKISILFKDGIPKEPEARFHRKYDSRLLVANGGNGWLDFNNRESGKGYALKVLAEFYGMSTKNFMSFGDNENDIGMLEASGISYVVDTATVYVKSHADYSCHDVLTV